MQITLGSWVISLSTSRFTAIWWTNGSATPCRTRPAALALAGTVGGTRSAGCPDSLGIGRPWPGPVRRVHDLTVGNISLTCSSSGRPRSSPFGWHAAGGQGRRERGKRQRVRGSLDAGVDGQVQPAE